VCHVRLTVRTLTFQTIRRHLQPLLYVCGGRVSTPSWQPCSSSAHAMLLVSDQWSLPRKIHRKLRFKTVCCHSLERQIVLGPKTRTYQARHIFQAENPKTPYRSGPRTHSTRRRRPTMPTRANQCRPAPRTVGGPHVPRAPCPDLDTPQSQQAARAGNQQRTRGNPALFSAVSPLRSSCPPTASLPRCHLHVVSEHRESTRSRESRPSSFVFCPQAPLCSTCGGMGFFA
jgi:hypothetical protein